MQNNDIGKKAATLKERNQARSQLAGAPLLVAQIGEQEFRKKLLAGDNTPLQSIRGDTWTTVAELMKIFGKIPPMSLLQICNPEFSKWMTEHLVQHANDLDFVQDILSAVGKTKELNPILNSVLAGFGRRKRHGRFKCSQYNLPFDQLRFATTATPEDSDLMVTELKSKTSQRSNSGPIVCSYFQKREGCRFSSTVCRFTHRCVICNKQNHGAYTCTSRNRQAEPVVNRSTREPARPPHPRFRRERANTSTET